MCSVVLMDSSANRWAFSFVLMDDENPSAQECLTMSKSWLAIKGCLERQREKEVVQLVFDGGNEPSMLSKWWINQRLLGGFEFVSRNVVLAQRAKMREWGFLVVAAAKLGLPNAQNGPYILCLALLNHVLIRFCQSGAFCIFANWGTSEMEGVLDCTIMGLQQAGNRLHFCCFGCTSEMLYWFLLLWSFSC